MNREIKFRAWDKKNKRFMSTILFNGTETHLNDDTGRKFELPEHMHLMQFTGLIDRFGIEIYEADIVRQWSKMFYEDDSEREPSNVKKVVRWNEKRAGYNIYRGDIHEVIGNIWENPELLEGATK